MNSLKTLFESNFGEVPFIQPLATGGSSRKYYRLTSGKINVVGVISEDTIENETFIRLDRLFRQQGIRVPEVFAVSQDLKVYLLQDLGDTSLFNVLSEPYSHRLVSEALKDLVNLQTLPMNLWEDKVAYSPFSKRLVSWDLNYFKYDFLKPASIIFDEEKLEDDFDRFTEVLTMPTLTQGLMYRDFQSRNIMLHDNKLWFIDFQGARKGPLTYDAVSFIWQAKAPFSFEEREELGREYSQILGERLSISPAIIEKEMHLMQIFRTLQVLGAYGFRGLIEKKVHFTESIPFAIRNLEYLKNRGRLDPYPEINRIASHMIDKEWIEKPDDDGKLTLKIFSFSYKQGYPEDKSGNGGGFMFDCRAIHNPGRYDEYKHLTGKDKPVQEFLNKTGEAAEFINHALAIVKPSVERYLKRGFTSLQVGFGCTGGQHRSVYCAETFGKIMSSIYPQIKVEVIHKNPII